MLANRSVARATSTFVGAALLAAHGVGVSKGGFAASEVQFFVHLFTNFVERDLTRPGEDLTLTQIGRVLRELVAKGWLSARGRATSLRGRSGSKYVVTADGLVELSARVADGATGTFEEALFALYFLRGYGPAIVARAGGHRPRALTSILDVKRVLKNAIVHAERIERDLALRAREGAELAEEVAAALQATRDVGKAADRLSRPGAYQLHGARPLSELLRALPDDLGVFELTRGITLRVELLFAPQLRLVRAHIETLRALAGHLA